MKFYERLAKNKNRRFRESSDGQHTAKKKVLNYTEAILYSSNQQMFQKIPVTHLIPKSAIQNRVIKSISRV